MGMIYEMTSVHISRNALVVSIHDLFIQMLMVFMCQASAKRNWELTQKEKHPFHNCLCLGTVLSE